MADVLYYDRDRGAARLVTNMGALREAMRQQTLEISLDGVSRARPFLGEACVEEKLLEDPLPFELLMINAQSDGTPQLLRDAKDIYDMNGRGCDRIVWLYNGAHPAHIAEQGVTCCEITGGNGHILPQDAMQIVQTLASLNGSYQQ